MTTTDVDLKTRVASASLDNGQVRWPELSTECLQYGSGKPREWHKESNTACYQCGGSGRIPNVTLETMLAALEASGVSVIVGWNKTIHAFAKIKPHTRANIHEEYKRQGTNPTAALISVMSAYLNMLEAASSRGG